MSAFVSHFTGGLELLAELVVNCHKPLHVQPKQDKKKGSPQAGASTTSGYMQAHNKILQGGGPIHGGFVYTMYRQSRYPPFGESPRNRQTNDFRFSTDLQIGDAEPLKGNGRTSLTEYACQAPRMRPPLECP